MNLMLKKIKLPTMWLSPAGIIIEQKYVTISQRELTTTILGKRKNITINELNREVINIRKQNNSMVPNIVHSFDASNIALLVQNVSSNFCFNSFNLLTFMIASRQMLMM
jgi:DNA-directed RNA polymerase